jgi:integrase
VRVAPCNDDQPEPEWLPLILEALANNASISDQGGRRLDQLVSRFASYLGSGQGIARLSDVRPEHVRGFVAAPSKDGKRSSPATMHLRRSVVRLIFRIARDLDLAASDPTIDLVLPPKVPPPMRPLSDEEVTRCRAAALTSLTETRLPAVWALAEATARTAEIPATRIADVDLQGRRVFLHGSTKVRPRSSELSPWGALQLTRRIRALGARDSGVLLAYGSDGSPESRQASAAVAIRTVLVRAGLGREAGLRPASVAAWAGARLLVAGHPIEEVARRLGMSSLDACVRLIGHDWKAGR